MPFQTWHLSLGILETACKIKYFSMKRIWLKGECQFFCDVAAGGATRSKLSSADVNFNVISSSAVIPGNVRLTAIA
jgi:hypothetical protein